MYIFVLAVLRLGITSLCWDVKWLRAVWACFALRSSYLSMPDFFSNKNPRFLLSFSWNTDFNFKLQPKNPTKARISWCSKSIPDGPRAFVWWLLYGRRIGMALERLDSVRSSVSSKLTINSSTPEDGKISRSKKIMGKMEPGEPQFPYFCCFFRRVIGGMGS